MRGAALSTFLLLSDSVSVHLVIRTLAVILDQEVKLFVERCCKMEAVLFSKKSLMIFYYLWITYLLTSKNEREKQ
jgi:hypothetical protein